MKKFIFLVVLAFSFVLPGTSFGQGMMGNNMMGGDLDDSLGHTAREEAEGKIIWEKLEKKEISCSNLTDDDFEVLGEYFMGQRVGAAHEAMNNMMIGMMGEEGEEAMHAAMGRRLSGCDESAIFPSQGANFMPVMNLMMGGGADSMMSFGWMPRGGNWGLMILWWGLALVGLVSIIKRLFGSSSPSNEMPK